MIKQLIAGLAIATLAIPQSVHAEVKGECYTTHGDITVCAVRHGESDWYSLAVYDPDQGSHPAVIVVQCDGTSRPSTFGWSQWEPEEGKLMARAFCEDLRGAYQSSNTVLS